MNFLARIFRYLFYVVIVSWGAALLKKIVVWMLRYAAGATIKQPRPAPAGGPYTAPAPETHMTSRRLVRDPVCGMHIAEVLAIPLREGSEIIHFCSTACRDAYVGSTRKMAANG